jgi:hypothetical protein
MARVMALITTLRMTLSKLDCTKDAKDDGDVVDAPDCTSSVCPLKDGKRAEAMNPANAPVPTDCQGYACVQACTSATVFAVSHMAARVCCIACFASSACCRKNAASSRSSYR